jgi:uncharacterized protein (TIGR02996 family)
MDEDALLAAICARPDDTAARLVFADYLLEQPEPAKRDRGEFILTQCRLAAGGLTGDERYDLQVRERALLVQHRDEWLAPLAGRVEKVAFSRGFPDRVSMTPDQLEYDLAEVVQCTPVARLKFVSSAPMLDIVAEVDALRHVVCIDLSRETIPPEIFRQFIASPHLTRLTSLNLSDNPIGDDGADALAAWPGLHHLTHLSLAGTNLSPAGVSRLLGVLTASRVPQLQWLNLRRNRLTKGNWADTVLAWLPPRTPARLRVSLEGQLGRFRTAPPPADPGPLPRMKAASGYTREAKALVAAFDIATARQFVAALKAHPLPAELHRAFAALCARRLEWYRHRHHAGEPLPDVPPADDPTGLAERARVVLDAAGSTNDLVAVWLRDWLLRLFERHLSGSLDPEGRTR